MGWSVPADNVLFELGLEAVLWAAHPAPPAYHRWRAPEA
jgi:hypothetical protein